VMSEIEGVKKKALEHITRCIDPEWHAVGYPAMAEVIWDGLYQLFEPYPKAIWSEKEEPCFWCKTPTHWLDIDYQGRVCSQRCQNEIAEDVKGLSKLEPDGSKSLVEWLCEYLARFNGNLDYHSLPHYRQETYQQMAKEVIAKVRTGSGP